MEKSTLESGLSKKDILEAGAKIGVLGILGAPTMGMIGPMLMSMDTYKYSRKRIKDELAKQNAARNTESMSKQDVKENTMQDLTAETQKEITGLANTLDKKIGPDSKKETMPDLQTQGAQQDVAGTLDAISQKTKIIPKGMDYRLTDPFELDEINNGSSDRDKIHLFESTTPTAEYYVIEDKIHHTATVYKNGQSILVVDTATGKKKGDALTVTTKDGKGNNNSTPAGMFRVSSTYIYSGGTSFQRSKIYEYYDIPSSVHVGDVPKDKNKCNISDGCTRISRESADKLSKYVTKNSRWYILPEEEKSGKFQITGNGISFVSNDEQKLHSEHARGTRNMTIQIPKELSGNKTLEVAVKSLESSKEVIMDKTGISSDTYDKLALLTLGLMGRESGYGEPGPRGAYGFVKDTIAGGILGRNVSAGAFQIKATSVPKPLVKKLKGDVKIDYASLVNPSTSAQYALLALYDIYIYNAPKFRRKYPDLSLEEITLAYYTNPAGVKNPEKHQMRIPYAREVLRNASKFKLKYQIPPKKDPQPGILGKDKNGADRLEKFKKKRFQNMEPSFEQYYTAQNYPNNCGPTACAIVAAKLLGGDPEQLEREFTTEKPGAMSWDTPGKLLGRLGLSVEQVSSLSSSEIHTYLQDPNCAIIASVTPESDLTTEGHITALVGSKKIGNSYTFQNADPKADNIEKGYGNLPGERLENGGVKQFWIVRRGSPVT